MPLRGDLVPPQCSVYTLFSSGRRHARIASRRAPSMKICHNMWQLLVNKEAAESIYDFFFLSLQNLKKQNKKTLLIQRTINQDGHRKQTQLS